MRSLISRGWSLCLPTVALVECLTGDPGRDARTNRVVRAVDGLVHTDERDARLAAGLRYRSSNPSVVDALVAAVSLRTTGLCLVLTTDPDDIEQHVSASRAARAATVRVLGC